MFEQNLFLLIIVVLEHIVYLNERGKTLDTVSVNVVLEHIVYLNFCVSLNISSIALVVLEHIVYLNGNETKVHSRSG